MVSGVNGLGMSASAMWESLLQRADTSGDGKISKEEFAANKPKDGQGPSVDDIFSKIDTNGDGYITEDENAVFISSMQAMQPPSPEEMFKQADTNGDGQLSKAEFTAMAPQGGKGPHATADKTETDDTSTDTVFDEMDTNQDGYISQTEYAAAIMKMMQNSPLQSAEDTLSTLA
jgi:Ca2+-binding EF-hand superfamily protein